jgi:hypothetical protein
MRRAGRTTFHSCFCCFGDVVVNAADADADAVSLASFPDIIFAGGGVDHDDASCLLLYLVVVMMLFQSCFYSLLLMVMMLLSCFCSCHYSAAVGDDAVYLASIPCC